MLLKDIVTACLAEFPGLCGASLPTQKRTVTVNCVSSSPLRCVSFAVCSANYAVIGTPAFRHLNERQRERSDVPGFHGLFVENAWSE